MNDGAAFPASRQQSSAYRTATALPSGDQSLAFGWEHRQQEAFLKLPVWRTAALHQGVTRCPLSSQGEAERCLGRTLNLGSEDVPYVCLEDLLSMPHEPRGTVLELPSSNHDILVTFSDLPDLHFHILKLIKSTRSSPNLLSTPVLCKR